MHLFHRYGKWTDPRTVLRIEVVTKLWTLEKNTEEVLFQTRQCTECGYVHFRTISTHMTDVEILATRGPRRLRTAAPE